MGKKVCPTEIVNRTRAYRLSHDERLQLMQDIRDNALEWLYDLVATRTSKGTSAAIYIFQQLTAQLKEDGATAQSNSIPLIAGFDPTKIVLPSSDA
jgi:hypothetical protein